jgi:hypothetical protein
VTIAEPSSCFSGRLAAICSPAKYNFAKRFKPFASPGIARNFLFRFSEIAANHNFVLRRQEGRIAIVTNVERDAMDAGSACDERGCSRTGKSCGPGAPGLALSSQRAIVASDGD